MLSTESDYEIEVAPILHMHVTHVLWQRMPIIRPHYPLVPVREKIGAVRLIPRDEVTVMLGNFSQICCDKVAALSLTETLRLYCCAAFRSTMSCNPPTAAIPTSLPFRSASESTSVRFHNDRRSTVITLCYDLDLRIVVYPCLNRRDCAYVPGVKRTRFEVLHHGHAV